MRASVIATAVYLWIIGITVAQDGNAAMRKHMDIPAQRLETALRALAQDRDLQLVCRTDVVGDLRTTGASGELTVSEALTQLLGGTGLTYRYLNQRTITIVPAGGQATASATSKDSAADSEEAQKNSFWDRFRVAQVDQGTPASTSSLERKPGKDSDQNPEKLEEVVVTAQKREERLLDVPISIVALTADELRNREITSLDELQFAVPGMAVNSDGYANKIELRGISNAVGVASLVGVYLDEADVTNGGGVQINPNTYDLERVEVLRGPQGTLYGEGSAGGTIRFITKNPALDRFGMTADVASLFTQHGSPGQRLNTAINVPLIENELGIRVVGTFDREGGWIDQPAASRKDINGQDLTNVRIKSLWRPFSQFSASFMAELYRNDRSTGNRDDVDGNFTQVFNLTTTPRMSEDHDIYNLTLTYDFPVVKILTATSYLREKVEGKEVGYRYPPDDFLSSSILSNDHAWVEELRVSSVGSGPWQWTVGGIYRHYRDVADQPDGYFGLPDGPFPSSYGSALADTLLNSWSAFGDVNYKLWDRVTLGVGVRSFHEKQDFTSVVDSGSGPVQIGQAGSFHSVDPRVYAQYKLSRDINIYASAAKGFRSGGFNSAPMYPTFDPENVWTYELGTKMSVLDGHLHAETAIFYSDYKDYVVAGLAHVGDKFSPFLNAGNARLKGVEWDFVWRPSEQWSLGINGDYIDTRFTRINATSTAYEAGDPLDFVPKYQMTSYAERDFTWNGKSISMRLDYIRRGRMTYRDRNQGLYSETDVINLLGYYVNLRWNESLSFNLFAQNLLNDRGLVTPDTGAFTRSRPRTYGVGFDVAL